MRLVRSYNLFGIGEHKAVKTFSLWELCWTVFQPPQQEEDHLQGQGFPFEILHDKTFALTELWGFRWRCSKYSGWTSDTRRETGLDPNSG